MALLKEDNTFTHVIAIDFGTGASGYFQPNIVSRLLPNSPIRMERSGYKFSILVMEVTIKRHLQQSFSMMIKNSSNLESMLFKNTHK